MSAAEQPAPALEPTAAAGPTPASAPNNLPPTARRRPATGRPAADLRQAVAGAVARAAAQGPLVPQGPEEASLTPEALQPPPLWPKSRRRPAPFPPAHTSSLPVTETEPTPARAARCSPVIGLRRDRAPDPRPLRGVRKARRPPRRGPCPEAPHDRPQTLPAGSVQARRSASNTRRSLRSSTRRRRTCLPRSNRRRSGSPAAQGPCRWTSTPDRPIAALVDLEVDTTAAASAAADPYDDFADLVRRYARRQDGAAERGRTDPGSAGPTSPDETPWRVSSLRGSATSPAPAEVAPAETDPEPRDSEPSYPEPDGPQASQAEEETAWPVGERRSAARQARKLLPAALQAAVAGTPPAERPPRRRSAARRPAANEDPEADTVRGSGKPPGIFRRYASAIAVVALFVAAGGAAAGIAALRGPIAQTASPTPAQEQAAASQAVLKASDFPAGWHVSRFTQRLLRRRLGARHAFDRAVLAQRPSGRASTLDAVSAGHDACFRQPGPGLEPSNQPGPARESRGRSPRPWPFTSSPAQVTDQVADIRTLLAGTGARACIGQFWSAALLASRPSVPTS